jgi:ketosteroid isomerase-like protein
MTVVDDERCACLVRAIRATVAGDSSTVDELFTEDVVAWSPTVSVRSRVELAVEMEDREEAFTEIELRTSRVVAARHWAFAEWVVSALHSGPLYSDAPAAAPPAAGAGGPIEPSGRRVSMRGVTLAEFDGSRICSVRHYWDEADLLAELGRRRDP